MNKIIGHFIKKEKVSFTVHQSASKKNVPGQMYGSNLCGQAKMTFGAETYHMFTCMSTIIEKKIAMFIMEAHQTNSTRIKYYLSFSKTRGPQATGLQREKDTVTAIS